MYLTSCPQLNVNLPEGRNNVFLIFLNIYINDQTASYHQHKIMVFQTGLKPS